MTTPTSLYILTSSQAPLPVRYPHPHKPRLVIPPLVHRTLHNALDKDPSSSTSSKQGYLHDERSGRVVIPHPDAISKHDLPSTSSAIGTGGNEEFSGKGVKTSMDTDTNVDNTPVQASDGDLELTLKLHLIAPSPTGSSSLTSSRSSWVQESLDILADYKGLTEVDTLLIGWKGVDYKGKRTAVSEFFGCGAEGMESASGGEAVSEELEKEVKECWGDIIREIRSGTGDNLGTRGRGKIRRLGTMYLPLAVLQVLTAEATQGKGEKPAINMLDTPDCHHLPHEYSGFAKENGIELWAGGGGEGAGESRSSCDAC